LDARQAPIECPATSNGRHITRNETAGETRVSTLQKTEEEKRTKKEEKGKCSVAALRGGVDVLH